MKAKVFIIFLCLWGNLFGQSVPNTSTFSLQDVVNVVTGTTLIQSFTNSIDAQFDPTYKGSKDRLYNFRNYTGIVLALPTVSTYDASNVTASSALLGGNVSSDGGSYVTMKGIAWFASMGGSVPYAVNGYSPGVGSFSFTITGLNTGTVYYVAVYATNSIGTNYGNKVSFTPYAATYVPIVTTSVPYNITSVGAIVGGNVTSDGGAYVSVKGVCWNTSPNPTTNNSNNNYGSGTGSYSYYQTGFSANTLYYVRAFATNSVGTSYGNQETFTTLANITTPTVTTTPSSNVTASTATSGGNVTSDGGATVSARGVCWSTSSYPTISDSKTSDGTGTGTFTSSITGLNSGATYYYRAYATNSAGTAYGANYSFSIVSITLPTVTTTSVTSYTSTSAIMGGNVTADGNATVTEKGVCYSISPNPTTNNFKMGLGNDTGVFSGTVNGLNQNSTYYVRAYAINSMGTAYGNQVSFTTSIILSAPTVTTTAATNITTSTVYLGGNVTSSGGATVSSRGVCYSTSQTPTLASSVHFFGSGTGEFSFVQTGLTSNTLYYARAFATNSVGTSYGNQVSFTTATNIVVPTVSATTLLTDAGWTAASSVTSDGGATVTVRGFCWSTSPNPTTANSHNDSGSGTGVFVGTLTGLSEGTAYYVRAYATNSAGTGYGSQVSFITGVTTTTPTVTTAAITNITATGATGGGEVTATGGLTVTSRGVQYSTNPLFQQNSVISSGSGLGVFTVNMAGLNTATTYYYRAYAVNVNGYSYGSIVSFVPQPPVCVKPTNLPIINLVTSANGILINSSQLACYWSNASNQSGTVYGSSQRYIQQVQVGGSEVPYDIIYKYLDTSCDLVADGYYITLYTITGSYYLYPVQIISGKTYIINCP